MNKILLKDQGHADWKTVLVFPEKYPTLKKGTQVEFIKEWSNFYGKWARVKTEDGTTYDVEPDSLGSL